MSEHSDGGGEELDLRRKLIRRNQLLDVIRRAYHRDIVSIKEYLLDAEQKGLSSIDANALASLPSIDLRGFLLFAPQECELNVLPCNECGGQLEIIHRESNRIVQYKNAIQQLEENEIDLRLELLNVKAQAKKDRDHLIDVVQRSKDGHSNFRNQIGELKSQLSASNAEIDRLTAEKASLEQKLDEQQPILLDHGRVVLEIEKEKKETQRWKEENRKQEEMYGKLQLENQSLLHEASLMKNTNEQLQSGVKSLMNKVQSEKSSCSSLRKELTESQARGNEASSRLAATEELNTTLVHDCESLSRKVCDLENDCKQLAVQTNDLELMLRHKEAENLSFRTWIKGVVGGDMEPTDAFATIDELVVDYEKVQQEQKKLSNLLASSTRQVYEICLVQESILTANGSELYKNHQLIPIAETSNESAQSVMGHLENADNSDVIEWRAVVENESDRNHVVSNLHNRLQIGHYSIEKTFEKERNRHERTLQKYQHENEKAAEQTRKALEELTMRLTEAQNVNRRYKSKLVKLQKYVFGIKPMLSSTEDLLANIRKEYSSGDNALHKLREDFMKLRTVTGNLLSLLQASRDQIGALNQTIQERDDDIVAREKVIETFEEMLQNITQRYADNERRRVKVTKEQSVQAVRHVVEVSTHADFLEKSPQQEKENQREALLPGRIFQIPEFQLSKLQFRKAIDRL
jgi:chromosome segregation ATPase